MKSLKYLIPAMAILVLAITPSLAFGQFNTGTQGCCDKLDHHWTLTDAPPGVLLGNVFSVDPDSLGFQCPGGWCPPSPGSWWINPTGSLDSNAPAGLYTYSMTFTFDGLTDIKGEFAADNSAEIWIGSVYTGIHTLGGSYGFQQYTPFDLGVLSGQQTLNFKVNNEGSYTGLEVEFFATTPEPSSLLLMGTGVLALIGVVRRKLVG
jgi:hypothetical protein